MPPILERLPVHADLQAVTLHVNVVPNVIALLRKLDFLLAQRPRLVLATYWIAAAMITHVPPIFAKREGVREEPLIGLDKVAHFVGYAGLAFLLMNALTRENAKDIKASASRRPSLRRPILLTLLLCAVWGIVDELTQPPFGRTADPADWAADLMGAGAGILVFIWFRRRSNVRA